MMVKITQNTMNGDVRIFQKRRRRVLRQIGLLMIMMIAAGMFRRLMVQIIRIIVFKYLRHLDILLH